MADNALQLPNSQVAFVGPDGLLTIAGRSALENVIRNLREQIAQLEATDVTISEALSAQTDLQAALDAKQPLDATLTALAGANWVLNALPIGTGADTVSQVAFAANRFPARASTGNLEAKTISDLGLSLVAASTAAAARAVIVAADDNNTVHRAGNESIAGEKTFSNRLFVRNARTFFAPNGELFALGFSYSGTRQDAGESCYIGATDSANPSLVFSDVGGAVVVSFNPGVSMAPGIDDTYSSGTSLLRWASDYVVQRNTSGAEHQTAAETPTQFTANVDNLAIAATSRILRLSSDASRNLTGIAGGAAGRRLTVSNVGAQDIVLVQDATSTAANRFFLPGGANLTLNAGDGVEAWYDSASSRWRIIGV